MTDPISLSSIQGIQDLYEAFYDESPDQAELAETPVGAPRPASVNAARSTPFPARFDAADLYGPSGTPREKDLEQDNIDDCYFVATMGAIARSQPERIQDAITYDAKTRTFNVTLYKESARGDAEAVTIPVKQRELGDNLKRGGASKVDNNPGTDGPIWPAVLETAYAKLNDSDWSNGLAQGYKFLDQGGFSRDATFVLTGERGTDLTAPKKLSVDEKVEWLSDRVSDALADDRPVTLETRIERGADGAQDGLADNHAYTVNRIYTDHNGDVRVQLRNPWATNNGVGEGKDKSQPIISVKLETLVATGGLERFHIGPEK
jgi:Calpain family cysteine protease